MTTPLPVPVMVDRASGRWSVDGVPMVLVPQHLITGVLDAAEAQAGRSSTGETLRAAGRLAARRWCDHHAEHHGLAGASLVRHYLDQLGRRGWGRFTVVELDLATGHVDVRVDGSAFATRQVGSATGACYPFAGWLEGAIDHVAGRPEPAGNLLVTEDRCVATGADHCRFRSFPDQNERADPSWPAPRSPR